MTAIGALVLTATACRVAAAPSPPEGVADGQAGTVQISGTVTQSDPICGGASPPASEASPVDVTRPFPNKTFHLIKGTTHAAGDSVIGRFTSDSTGHFSFRLAPGTYSILLEEQIAPPDVRTYESRFVKMDEACFKEWWAKPYSTLQVGTSDMSELRFHFAHRCFIKYDIPCLRYIGPLPG
jgi:hypothetical protein